MRPNRTPVLQTVVILLGLLLASTASAQTILYVDDDAPPGGDGLSWSRAFADLQDALEAASGPSGEVTEIHVAEGTYKPDRGTGDRTATFELSNSVSVLGGYGGLRARDPHERDLTSNVSILSGDLLGDDGAEFANYTDNSLHVAVGHAATLDGFTITGGNADAVSETQEDAQGGGLYVAGDLAVNECVFGANHASFSGGAVSGGPTSTLVITNCTFDANRVVGDDIAGGGAIHTRGDLQLTDCEFRNNYTASDQSFAAYGGALYADHFGVTSLTRCTFESNRNDGANAFGGGVFTRRIEGPVTDCVFRDNATTADGGGMYCADATNVAGCLFEANTADRGGGLFKSYEESVTLTHCVFNRNEAAVGGGVYGDGSDLAAINCAFVANIANLGGGAYQQGRGGLFQSCTMYANTAGDTGGGVYSDSLWSDPQDMARLHHCILWHNTDSSGSDEDAQVYFTVPAGAKVNYSCIEGLTGDLGGVKNIGQDPLFVNPKGADGIPGTADDDLHLLPDSPAVNAGDPFFVPESGWLDFDGEQRVQYCLVDLGVDESAFFEDCNANGAPDACECIAGEVLDCNTNRVPDECDVRPTGGGDCNTNGLPDDCDARDAVITLFADPFTAGAIQSDRWPEVVGADAVDVDYVSWPRCLFLDEGGTAESVEVDLSMVPEASLTYNWRTWDTWQHELRTEYWDGAGWRVLTVHDGSGGTLLWESALLDLPAGAFHAGFRLRFVNVAGREPAGWYVDDVEISYVTPTAWSDCNTNRIPDECEPDCNTNGVADECDIRDGMSDDCNTDGQPDECEISQGTSGDCDTDGLLDECEIAGGTAYDCNGNAIPDDCEVADGTAEDCNSNGIPDACDVRAGPGAAVFFENFPDLSLSPERWQAGAGYSFTHHRYVSSPLSLDLDRTDWVETVAVDLYSAQAAQVSYYWLNISTEPGDDLELSYWDGVEWRLFHVEPAGPDVPDWQLATLGLPWAALHDGFRLRLAASCNTPQDDWYIDDLTIMAADDATSWDCDGGGVPDECGVPDSGDADGDGDVDLADYRVFLTCFAGAGAPPGSEKPACLETCRSVFDLDHDTDVDLDDFAAFGSALTGP